MSIVRTIAAALVLGGVLLPSAYSYQGRALRDLSRVPEEARVDGIRTHPAPCQLTAEIALRVADDYGDLLLDWAGGASEASESLDLLQRTLITRFAGFEVNDRTLHNLLVMPNGKIVIPGISCLERIEKRVLERLFASEPSTALSVYRLYLGTFVIQEAGRRPPRRWLATRTRERMLQMVDMFLAESGQTPAALEAGSSMLVALAEAMRGSAYLTSIRDARELFSRAAKMDPNSVAAAYWSAILGERLSDFEGAAESFEDLARREPEDEEVHLRWALNLARTGRAKRAHEELEDLAATATTSWIRVLSYQELAKLQSNAGDREGTLRLGLVTFPGDPQLTLQLLPMLDNWEEVDTLVARTSRPQMDQGRSPRLMYDVPRLTELVAELDEFEALAARASEDLERLVSRTDSHR